MKAATWLNRNKDIECLQLIKTFRCILKNKTRPPNLSLKFLFMVINLKIS